MIEKAQAFSTSGRRRVKLFSNPDRALAKTLERAEAASDSGDFHEAARLYGEVADRAAAARGPDDPISLTAREDSAASYLAAGELERGRRLLVDLIPEMESARSLGPDSEYTINARLNLAASYGVQGDHAKVCDLVAPEIERAERALGAEHTTTFEAREALATAERELAEPELDRLLGTSTDQGVLPGSEDWGQLRLRFNASLDAQTSYRSKRRMDVRSPESTGSVEWMIEVGQSGDVRVLQTIRESGDELHDLWVVIGRHRFQNVGAWVDTSTWPAEEQQEDDLRDRSLKVDILREILDTEPTQVAPLGDGYVAEFATVPRFVKADNSDVAARERTVLWLGSDDRMTRARFDLERPGSEIHVTQAFADWGARILISRPPAEIVVASQ
jgi:hypothetical protein